jgi:hypothetical protein
VQIYELLLTFASNNQDLSLKNQFKMLHPRGLPRRWEKHN